MQYYEKILDALKAYFTMKNWKDLFLHGGCYWLANVLHLGIPASSIMINRKEEHCALFFQNGLYDIRGKISAKQFRIAGERDICFMQKNYIPQFDVKKLEEYLTGLLLL